MNERDTDVPELLETLRNAPIGVASVDEIEAERERLVPWLAQGIEAIPAQRRAWRRQQTKRRVLAASFALAALLPLGFVVSSLTSGRLSVGWPQQSSSLDPNGDGPYATLLSGKLESGSTHILPGSRLATSSVVQTPSDQGALFQSSTGYRAELAPKSQLDFGGPEQKDKNHVLKLNRGRVALSVPPLPSGSTLSVTTSDAQVTVRGTRFSVTLEEGSSGQPRTCVEVTEGAVEVTRKSGSSRLLRPGESDGCAATESSSIETSQLSPQSQERSAPRAANRTTAKSTLAVENRLLAQALAAERRGELDRAEQQLLTLIQRHPDSPFSREARDALARVRAKKSP